MIRPGHLLLLATPDKPGHVNVATADEMPEPPPQNLLWAARFNDIETAAMHAHNRLCRKLVDIDQHLYKVATGRAIAALDTESLRHERVYLEDALSEEVKADIEQWSGYYTKRHHWANKVITWFGYLFVGYLLFLLVFGF